MRSRRTSSRPWTAAAVLPALLLAAACGDGGDDSTGPDANSIANTIVALSTVGGTTATLNAGTAPTGGSGAAPELSPVGALIPGGGGLVEVSANTAFSTVVLALEGASGHYRLDLPAPVTETTLSMTIAEDPPSTTLSLQAAVGTGGSVGSYDELTSSLTMVGTGEVQVSVAWDTQADVDLHLVTPSGAEIYYGNPTADGGQLDLDSNASCSGDDKRQENITFADAPSGQYTVRVDYWSACGAAATNYVVTVRVRGRAAQTFTGQFTGSGDFGGEGDGLTITQFTL